MGTPSATGAHTRSKGIAVIKGKTVDVTPSVLRPAASLSCASIQALLNNRISASVCVPTFLHVSPCLLSFVSPCLHVSAYVCVSV